MDSDWMRDDEGLAKSQFKEPQMESWQKRQALCGKNLCYSVLVLMGHNKPIKNHKKQTSRPPVWTSLKSFKNQN